MIFSHSDITFAGSFDHTFDIQFVQPAGPILVIDQRVPSIRENPLDTDIAFQAAAIAATAIASIRFNGGMSDLSGRSIESFIDKTVDDQPASNTRAEFDVDQVVIPESAAPPFFRDGRGIGIIFEIDRGTSLRISRMVSTQRKFFHAGM